MSRIQRAFAAAPGATGLIPYVTAGVPSLDATRELLLGFARLGARAVEIGVPFSDPIADGPDIQRASERAVRAGIGVAEVVEVVRDLRRTSELPVVVMSYANPLLRGGLERTTRALATAGVDGLLVSDLPPDESPESWTAIAAAGLDPILLVAPTTPEARLPLILERARGFLYCLARTGVTGAGPGYAGDLERRLADLRRRTRLPLAVGFGIGNADQAHALRGLADAVVVGAAFMRLLTDDDASGVSRALALAETLVQAVRPA